jgi:pimeloyl-ACP methyl ester carboxylesterase
LIPFLVLAAVIVGPPLLGWLYQWRGAKRDARRHPPPGRILGGFHVFECGQGRPPVVLEAGIAASSASWKPVQDQLGRQTTVVAYDRAGFGWSAARPAPRRLPVLVEELRAVLELAGISEPAVFCGHSFGGLLLRHFAARFPERVAGLVLVDPLMPLEWHPAPALQLYRLGKGARLARRGALLARFGVVRLGLDLLLAGSRRLPQMLSRVSSGRGSAVTDRLVGELRKLPPEVWPVIRSHWCLPRSFSTLAAYLELLPDNCAEPLDDRPLASLPLCVISAPTSTPEVLAAHQALAALSSEGRHVMADASGHWIQLDRPELIAAEVIRLLGAARLQSESGPS